MITGRINQISLRDLALVGAARRDLRAHGRTRAATVGNRGSPPAHSSRRASRFEPCVGTWLLAAASSRAISSGLDEPRRSTLTAELLGGARAVGSARDALSRRRSFLGASNLNVRAPAIRRSRRPREFSSVAFGQRLRLSRPSCAARRRRASACTSGAPGATPRRPVAALTVVWEGKAAGSSLLVNGALRVAARHGGSVEALCDGSAATAATCGYMRCVRGITSRRASLTIYTYILAGRSVVARQRLRRGLEKSQTYIYIYSRWPFRRGNRVQLFYRWS